MMIKWDLETMEYEGANREVLGDARDIDRLLILNSLERQLGEMHTELGYDELEFIRMFCYEQFELALQNIYSKRKKRMPEKSAQLKEEI
ncbi:hypothetical protein [Enterococcus sp. AZ012]|uniref:hypothetical protein n=1 Tax=Enterococcus sp. AZ012 TaxID=2774682 RepID=UPI003D27DAE7